MNKVQQQETALDFLYNRLNDISANEVQAAVKEEYWGNETDAIEVNKMVKDFVKEFQGAVELVKVSIRQAAELKEVKDRVLANLKA